MPNRLPRVARTASIAAAAVIGLMAWPGSVAASNTTPNRCAAVDASGAFAAPVRWTGPKRILTTALLEKTCNVPGSSLRLSCQSWLSCSDENVAARLPGSQRRRPSPRNDSCEDIHRARSRSEVKHTVISILGALATIGARAGTASAT